MIRFGISGLPPDGDDAGFLDDLVRRGHHAFEFAFTSGFPWKERRCEAFGRLAAERDIAISIHAPYFAILTSDDPEKAKLTRSAVEHTMKLGHAFGSRVIVAHTGYVKRRTSEQLHELAAESLAVIEPKVRHLGVALGLEVGGSDRAFGTLGDIALIARTFPFVHPVVDWAHVHAMSGGALTTVDNFLGVFAFLRDNFPGWALDPLHCQFTDNEFGHTGEIRHVPYGQGTLRVTPLVEAAVEAGGRITLISEGRVAFPQDLRVVADGDGFTPIGVERRVRLSNPDKPFFPGGETKGDLVAYYHSVAPVLLPHLLDRAIVLARFPDGADGAWFYEKQAPSHKPEWLPTAPLWSGHRGDVIDFVTAPEVASLLWIANLGAIEIHPWLSRVATAPTPDFAIFDLDPADGATWDQVVTVAEVIRVALERLGLTGYPKTSGATGLHIYVPLDPVHPYDRVRHFVESVGRLVVAADPGLASMEWDVPH